MNATDNKKLNTLWNNYPNPDTPKHYYLRMKFQEICNNILYPKNRYMTSLAYTQLFEDWKIALIQCDSLIVTISSWKLVIQKIIEDSINDCNNFSGLSFNPIIKLVLLMRQQEELIATQIQKRGKEALKKFVIRISDCFVEFYLNSDNCNIKDPYIENVIQNCLKRKYTI